MTRFPHIFGCLLLLLIAPILSAHQYTITRTQVRFLPDMTYEVDFEYELDAMIAGVPAGSMFPEVYEYILEMPEAEVRQHLEDIKKSLLRSINIEFDGVEVRSEMSYPDIGVNEYHGPIARILPGPRARFAGPIPEGAEKFIFRASRMYGVIDFCYVGKEGEILVQELLTGGSECSPIPIDRRKIVPPTRTEVALRFILLGFTHILPGGLDHILFVLGLFLLSARWRPLLWQVTAFTIAHSVTLGLSIYGIISLPPSIVEPLIALSIAYVAIENIFTQELKPWRPAVVFAFGLLHGLGFAGVLSELGLPREEFLTAVITFNIGVEAGQLAVILGAFALVGFFQKREWYRRRIIIPASCIIAIVALFWTWDRTFGEGSLPMSMPIQPTAEE